MLAPDATNLPTEVIILATAVGPDDRGPQQWPEALYDGMTANRIQAVTVLNVHMATRPEGLWVEAKSSFSFSTRAELTQCDPTTAERTMLAKVAANLAGHEKAVLLTLGGHAYDLPALRLGYHLNLLPVPGIVGIHRKGIDFCEVFAAPSYEAVWRAFTGRNKAALERAVEHAEAKAYVAYALLLRYLVATGIATTADYETAVHSLATDLLADYWFGSPHLQERLLGLVEIATPQPDSKCA
ncbi:MAG: hypothetical protein ACM33T_06045 [Solirubrobacterales bacterium]